jgi:outer membrane protein assembly factor BamB
LSIDREIIFLQYKVSRRKDEAKVNSRTIPTSTAGKTKIIDQPAWVLWDSAVNSPFQELKLTMDLNNLKLPATFIYLLYLLLPVNLLSAQTSWSQALTGIGTLSSPRVADLNGDGTGDIIMGAGRLEFQTCDSAVIALDGKTGQMLWHVPARDQIFGSAAFRDINGDGTEDVIIGGRSAELIAINGRSGEVIWRFSRETKKIDGSNTKWYNFYNPQFIPDQNQDGQEDILVSNGGNVLAEPHDTTERPAGYLLVLDGRSGQLLGQAEMPDRKEIYMSVTVSPTPDGKDYEILFGTGGETVGGHLYLGYLSQVMKGDLSEAVLLDSSPHKGYVGPGVRVDITGDGIPDIACGSVDGRLLTFDGKDLHRLWEVTLPNAESYTSLAVGLFTADSIPDFFLSWAQGSWPDLDWNVQKMINGKTGLVEFSDSLGHYQISSPIVIDFDGDGRQEVLMSLNFQQVDELYRKFFYTTMIIIDFSQGKPLQIGAVYEGSNFASTPWAGDLDGDGFLDIIYCHSTNARHTYTFDGFQIHRIPSRKPVGKGIRWGAYQGSGYDGIFRKH